MLRWPVNFHLARLLRTHRTSDRQEPQHRLPTIHRRASWRFVLCPSAADALEFALHAAASYPNFPCELLVRVAFQLEPHQAPERLVVEKRQKTRMLLGQHGEPFRRRLIAEDLVEALDV